MYRGVGFERGIDPKKKMDIGFKPKKLARVLQWKKGYPGGGVGFYILGHEAAHEVLKNVSNGKRSIIDYMVDMVEFIGERPREILLRELRGEKVEYDGIIYYIPEHHEI
jgi:hypothetical protein